MLFLGGWTRVYLNHRIPKLKVVDLPDRTQEGVGRSQSPGSRVEPRRVLDFRPVLRPATENT
ncbi:hypothetical protein Ddye_008244 [Dipteronia dyeriana]|uniref:Uncharacterized protein n=1 Tax=Dipteronia dyeriana TaxID=168575 RepID=A0AAD9X9G5_9ROSI|nr:hypothetical protein Ddye_008244 [Dipteronia dyeriana]